MQSLATAFSALSCSVVPLQVRSPHIELLYEGITPSAVEVAVHVQLPEEDAGGLFVDRRHHEELTKTKRTRF